MTASEPEDVGMVVEPLPSTAQADESKAALGGSESPDLGELAVSDQACAWEEALAGSEPLPSPAQACASDAPLVEPEPTAHWARAARPGMFAGADFTLQDDGTLRCPTGQILTVRERRQGPAGTLRLYYMASAHSCASCPCREQCLRKRQAARHPRKVSMLVRAESPPPRPAGNQPFLLKDGPRCQTRRGWMRLMRRDLVEINPLAAPAHGKADPPAVPAGLLTRAQRAHWRLSWQERLARNTATSQPPRWQLRLHGLPAVLTAIVQSSS